MRFDITNISDLNEYLRGTSIHDSIIEDYNYNGDYNSFVLRVFNPFYNKGMIFVFSGVECLKFKKGREVGCYKTISSLTVEDCCSVFCCSVENKICILFQMFSGDELYILFENLYVDNITQGTKHNTGDGSLC